VMIDGMVGSALLGQRERRRRGGRGRRSGRHGMGVASALPGGGRAEIDEMGRGKDGLGAGCSGWEAKIELHEVGGDGTKPEVTPATGSHSWR